MVKTKTYYFYMLRCVDNSLYCGITTDLERRVEEHNSKKSGAKYTRSKNPVKLVYSEKFDNKPSALKREIYVKKLSKKEKEQIVNQDK